MRDLGFGLGLRSKHYEEILQTLPKVDWFEALTENYMGIPGGGYGRPLKKLLKVRENYPITLHGVSLGIGNLEPVSEEYLKRLSHIVEVVQPEWVSDHLCWTGFQGYNSHDLLPLAYNQDVLDHICSKILTIQDRIKRPLLLENVSTYIEFKVSEMSESEFISHLTKRTDVGVLLDINNVYVNSVNHGFCPRSFIDEIPKDRICQIHLAGHQERDGFLVDTHDSNLVLEVKNLYKWFIEKNGPCSTMIEWDSQIPDFTRLMDELKIVKELAQ